MRNSSIGEISPSISGTASGKPSNMASLNIVWCEFNVDIILVKIRLELVVLCSVTFVRIVDLT